MPINQPALITVPFAASGLKNAIPQASDTANGKAGYDQGFPASNMTPKSAGGIPPFGQDFNGILFDVTTALQYLEAGGVFPFSQSFATTVGGYPVGALVARSDKSGLWRNFSPNNTTDPEAGGAGWMPEDGGSTNIVMTNANVTLTPLQASKNIIFILGALAANLQLILPSTYIKQWLIVNGCTGNFTITVKTPSGAGVVTNPGDFKPVFGDGNSIQEAAGNGKLIGVQAYTAAGGVYVPTPGTKSVVVEVQGGGGGGGGAPATASGAGSAGGGGGAGGYSKARLTSGFGGVTVSLGAGGAGGTATPSSGSGGGTSSFGGLVSASGGGGGSFMASTVAFPIQAAGANGAVGGAGNVLTAPGAGGGAGVILSAGNGISGNGGSSQFGGGGFKAVGSAAGGAGTYGGGGGGAISQGNTGGGFAGGAGGLGVVIIWEYS